ncbi:LCP family protein [Candidatus Roizmanbacteria bacterium]|nr:LCP family protein [Candidatus Roizmanbacteria bacterium]
MSVKKLGIGVGFILVCIVVFIAFRVVRFYQHITKGSNTVNSAHTATKEQKTTYNILFMGYGGAGHDGAYLTDTLMIAHVDTKKNEALLVSIPRDLWVKLPTKSGADFFSKINSVYQMGLYPKTYPDVNIGQDKGTDALKSVVSEVTGITIDNTIGLDFGGFKKSIDVLGGVDVNVEKTFDDYEYPVDGKENDLCGKEAEFAQVEKFMKPGYSEDEKKQLFKDKPELETFFNAITQDPAVAFPCRYEHLHFNKGITHMDGTTALKYARSRHSLQDGTDFGRAARQQRVIEAVRDKILAVGFIPKILSLLDTIQDHITMDIGLAQLEQFISEAKDMGKYKINHLVLSDQNFLKNSYSDYGGYILIPRQGIGEWSTIHTSVAAALDGRMDVATQEAELATPTASSTKK